MYRVEVLFYAAIVVRVRVEERFKIRARARINENFKLGLSFLS